MWALTLRLGLLQGQQMILTAEYSLQSLSVKLKKKKKSLLCMRVGVVTHAHAQERVWRSEDRREDPVLLWGSNSASQAFVSGTFTIRAILFPKIQKIFF